MPCPVCVGVKLREVRPWAETPLVIDHCERCGGVWFDAGEALKAKLLRPQSFRVAVQLGDEAYRMKCHVCLASFRRNEDRCPACGWENRLECPRCGKDLEPVRKDDLKLDACRACRGVWFDNAELAELWNRKVAALPAVQGTAGPALVRRDHFSLGDVLVADPLTTWVVADAAGNLAHAAAPALGGLGQAAGGAVEATGELAGSVFEAIAGLIGSIFEGLGDLF
jgi:Zn-finger nucleic acid-binding protein